MKDFRKPAPDFKHRVDHQKTRSERYFSDILRSTQFTFGGQSCLSTLATRGRVAKTSLFLEDSLSGTDNGRDRLIKAWSGLGSVGDFSRLQRESSLGGCVLVQIGDQG